MTEYNMASAIIKNFDIWLDAQGIKSRTRAVGVDNISFEGVLNLRKLILNLAFSGKLSEKKQNDGSAKELLELIRFEENKSIFDINSSVEPYPIPMNWIWCRFGDISNHNSGKTLDSGKNKGELRDYITTSNLYWGFFKLDGLKQMRLTEEELDRCTAIRGDLLICEGGEAGRSAVWVKEESICFQNHIHRVRPLHGIDPYYLFFYMMKIFHTGEINNYRKGVGIHNLSGKALSSILIPMAPIQEQYRIVAIVDKLMVLCDKLEEEQFKNLKTHQTLVKTLLETLTKASDVNELKAIWKRMSVHFDTLFSTNDSIEQLKQCVLQLAVMGKLVKQNPKNETAIELLKKASEEKAKLFLSGKIKKYLPSQEIQEEEKLFNLPQGWAWARLQEITTLITDGKHGDCQNQLNSGYYFLSAKDIVDGKLNYEFAREINYEEFQETHRRTDLSPGDICMVNTGATVGKLAIASDDPKTQKTTFQKSVAIIKPFKGFIINNYLKVFLMSDTKNMFIKSGGSAINNLLLGDLKKKVIPLPPISEQIEIVKKVDELFLFCDKLSEKIKSSQKTQVLLSKSIVEKFVQ